jgi:hypothetical protein
VLEISSTGRYQDIQWIRNGGIRGVPGSAFSPSERSFAHFDEVYFVERTTMKDLGTYEIGLYPAPGQQAGSAVQIHVVSLGN